jgi:3'(2'), 5'-bisphosphate nucleotidase
VTEADLISEKVIVSGLKKYNLNFLSEETKDNFSLRLKEERIWIIDPLDGTNDFLQKTDEFSIMIAQVYGKKPFFGIVYVPAKNKLYFAEENRGAYLKEGNNNPKRLQVSDITKLSDSHFVVSRTHLGEPEKKFMKANNIKKAAPVGSVGVKVGLIAEGKAEGYISFSDKTCQWDIAAPEIILREAGGEVTDLKGNRFVYNRKEIRNLNGIVATNGKIHQQIIDNIAI